MLNVKPTSCKRICFGEQKQKSLPQCKFCSQPQWEGGTGSWCGNSQGQLQSLPVGRDLSCYLLLIINYLLVSSMQCAMETLWWADPGAMDLPGAQAVPAQTPALLQLPCPAFPCSPRGKLLPKEEPGCDRPRPSCQ